VADTRKFGLQLVEDLVVPHLRRRMSLNGMQIYLKQRAEVYLGDNLILAFPKDLIFPVHVYKYEHRNKCSIFDI
jgi:hypothetical protein